MSRTVPYSVVYRTGGYLNAKWHRMINYPTRDAAQAAADDVERMGYKTIVQSVAYLDAIGLPVGYCSECDSITGECRKARPECKPAVEAING